MTCTTTLLDRNREFAIGFTAADLPVLPRLRTVIIACGDARVDPAHIFGLEPGEAVVIRNNGGRVTDMVVDELAALSFMVAKMDGPERGRFEVVIVRHTQCGAERFADPDFQKLLKKHVGVDVSSTAIHDHELSLHEDVERMRSAPELPGYVIVSGYLYDVSDGSIREVVKPAALIADTNGSIGCGEET